MGTQRVEGVPPASEYSAGGRGLLFVTPPLTRQQVSMLLTRRCMNPHPRLLMLLLLLLPTHPCRSLLCTRLESDARLTLDASGLGLAVAAAGSKGGGQHARRVASDRRACVCGRKAGKAEDQGPPAAVLPTSESIVRLSERVEHAGAACVALREAVHARSPPAGVSQHPVTH